MSLGGRNVLRSRRQGAPLTDRLGGPQHSIFSVLIGNELTIRDVCCVVLCFQQREQRVNLFKTRHNVNFGSLNKVRIRPGSKGLASCHRLLTLHDDPVRTASPSFPRFPGERSTGKSRDSSRVTGEGLSACPPRSFGSQGHAFKRYTRMLLI